MQGAQTTASPSLPSLSPWHTPPPQPGTTPQMSCENDPVVPPNSAAGTTSCSATSSSLQGNTHQEPQSLWDSLCDWFADVDSDSDTDEESDDDSYCPLKRRLQTREEQLKKLSQQIMREDERKRALINENTKLKGKILQDRLCVIRKGALGIVGQKGLEISAAFYLGMGNNGSVHRVSVLPEAHAEASEGALKMMFNECIPTPTCASFQRVHMQGEPTPLHEVHRQGEHTPLVYRQEITTTTTIHTTIIVTVMKALVMHLGRHQLSENHSP
ncbi:hypothetical protein Pelo_18589 [Pelomyxa schiedti]|nr:hypothetical protein Pelo_18589 [Pelomyxa schiedti]